MYSVGDKVEEDEEVEDVVVVVVEVVLELNSEGEELVVFDLIFVLFILV